MWSMTGTEVVIWDIMCLGDFEKYVFLLEISRVFCLFFLAEKKCKCSIKCHPSTSIYLIFKNKTMVDNVCLEFLSLNLTYQLLTITYLILLCGDVESNPGPNLLNLQTFEGYEKHKANANLHPCFVYTNIRSVNNKHEEILDFLLQQNRQTCFIVLETWINDNQKIPVNFLSNNHHFVHQSRSILMQLTTGGGVGIWVPNTLQHKIRNDLNSINKSLLNHYGLKYKHCLRKNF